MHATADHRPFVPRQRPLPPQPQQSFPPQSYPQQSYPRQSYPQQSFDQPARPSMRYRPIEEETEVISYPMLTAPSTRPSPVPARRPRRMLTLTLGVLVAVGVVAGGTVGGFWVVQQRDAVPTTAAVGSCVSRSGDSSVATVGCGTPGAQFTVVGRVDGRTEAQAAGSCTGIASATTTYWKGAAGGTGTVLCLAPVAAK